MNEVLAGVRVLDLTNALAASSATKILADLGWEPEPEPAGERSELTMPAVDLARLFGRLNREAGAELRDVLAATADDRGDAQRMLLARTVYGDVLARLAGDALAGERDEPSPPPHGGEPDDSTGPR